jgi:hypothetical protein
MIVFKPRNSFSTNYFYPKQLYILIYDFKKLKNPISKNILSSKLPPNAKLKVKPPRIKLYSFNRTH